METCPFPWIVSSSYPKRCICGYKFKNCPFVEFSYSLIIPKLLLDTGRAADNALIRMSTRMSNWVVLMQQKHARLFKWMLSQPRAVRGRLATCTQIYQIPCFCPIPKNDGQEEMSHSEQRHGAFRNLWSGEERRPSLGGGAWLVLRGRTSTSFFSI